MLFTSMNYFSHQQQEIDWSAFVLAQMQVLLDTVNVKNFDKTVTQINQIHCNKFVLVNWKSNHLVVIETK